MKKKLSELTLVLGGAACGKSLWAEELVLSRADTAVYVATAQAFDDEMAEKILDHRARRDQRWTTVEEAHDLPDAIAACPAGEPVLIDCATLWLTNRMLAEADTVADTDALLDVLTARPSPVVIVSNEVGDGIVPADALSRRFRNAQGQLNQRLAASANLVVRITAGLPQVLKGTL